ncbi:hypothetical protein ACU686_12615 [Yinghuangia aomiensis]
MKARFEFSDARADADRDMLAVPRGGETVFWQDDAGAVTAYRVFSVDWIVTPTETRVRIRLFPAPGPDPFSPDADAESRWRAIGAPER